MQYTPSNAEAVVAGRKTLTHRVWREGDEAYVNLESWGIPDGPLTMVEGEKGHIRFEVGRVEAIQPGRGKRGIGYQRTTSIHGPHLIQEITEEECLREGITKHTPGLTVKHLYGNGADREYYFSAYGAFAALWDSIYGGQKGKQWADNPRVWGIGVEYVGQERPR